MYIIMRNPQELYQLLQQLDVVETSDVSRWKKFIINWVGTGRIQIQPSFSFDIRGHNQVFMGPL
jgi:hypothetical protein